MDVERFLAKFLIFPSLSGLYIANLAILRDEVIKNGRKQKFQTTNSN